MGQRGVNYFFHHFVTGDHSPERGYLNYIPAVLGADGDHPTLVASMAAVGLVALANSTRQPELVRHARAKYSQAICSLNDALACPVESCKDSVLMSVISLGVFEHFSNFESWVRHVQGAAALVVVRGRGQFRSKVSILMFNQVRADMIISCLHTNRPFPQDMLSLQEEACNYTDPMSTFWLLGVYATRCVNLLFGVHNKVGGLPWSHWIEEASTLQSDFQYILGTLGIQEPYSTIRQSALDPAVAYNGRYDVYSSPWAIRVWNHARIMQMIVSEIMFFLLNGVLRANPPPPSSAIAAATVKVQDTVQILSGLGSDLIATVPQVLGVVGPDRLSAASDAGVSGGYLLIWSLYMVGKCPVTTDKAQKWVIGHMRQIVGSSGIAMAERLLDDVVRIDNSCASERTVSYTPSALET
jgi:hypothetical protein